MQIHEVKRNTKRAKSVRIGRGGKRGKTSGRGHKGQMQHGGHGVRPETRDIIKKLPKLRGRGINTNKSIKADAKAINLATLEENFSDKEIVTPKVLFKKGLVRKISGKLPVVKILGNGDITKKVTITDCGISVSAKEKIEKAGGKVILK
jgi:large subunit ribosomal protein L15